MPRAVKAVETATAPKTTEVADKLRALSDDELMTRYIGLRDAIDAESKAFKERVGKAVTVMEQIEAVMLQRLDERKADSTASKTATAFFQNKTFCNVEDWEKTLAWVLENGAYQFLNKSVSKTAVAEYIAEHKDDVPDEDGEVPDPIPPGIKWGEERSLVIRRK